MQARLWKYISRAGVVALSIGATAALLSGAANAATASQVIVQPFTQATALTFATNTPVALEYQASSVSFLTKALQTMWSQATVYSGMLPPEPVKKVVFHAYIGAPMLTVQTKSGVTYEVHPAARIDKGQKGYAVKYFPSVIVVKWGSHYQRIQDPALYRWFLDNGWKSDFDTSS